MKRHLLAVSAMVLMLGCSGPPAPTVPESEIGLAPGTAFEQPPQAPIPINQIEPGESELRQRPNTEFPPVIPHSITDFENITLAENSCVDCHDPATAEDMGAVALPESHLVDLRRSPEVTGQETVGSRWVCTSCHVVHTETEPLVANSPSG